ncbi:uncharacterized protein [Ptychodera flava]|uniref:uncharacterized protein isoform X2 n=1 Tax=Ptychodera flava TaxID=63121 RepID=UPI00396A712C
MIRSVNEGDQVLFTNSFGEILVGNVDIRKSAVEVCVANSSGSFKRIVRDVRLARKVSLPLKKQQVMFVTSSESSETEGFPILKFAEITEVCSDESVWIRPSDDNCELKVSVDEICEKVPNIERKVNDIHKKIVVSKQHNPSDDEVHDQIAATQGIIQTLHSLVGQFNTSLIETHDEYNKDLLALSYENIASKDKLCELQMKYREVVQLYYEVKSKFSMVVRQGQIRENELLDVIKMKDNEISNNEKEIMALNTNIHNLITKYEKALTEAKTRIVLLEKELEAKKQQCTKVIEESMIKDEKIRSLENNIAQLKAKAHVQVLSRDKDTFVCRSPESDKRGTAYHKLAKPAIASSIASQKSLEQRANALKSFLDSLSAKGEATTDDIVSTLAKFATIYKDVYTQAGIKAGILASQERNSADDNVEVGVAILPKNASAKGPSKVAYVRRPNLEHIVQTTYDAHVSKGNISADARFNDEVWVLVGGDKGGTTTKLCLQLANVGNCGADNIELVAMFEAYDSYDNMKQIFGMYTEQVEALQTNFSVKISDNRFQVLRAFLYGDYAFLCNVLGHQGAASKHPCLWCDIAKQQLSKGVPHCSVKLDSVTNTFIANPDWEPRVRSIAQMQNDLIQYNSDDKKDGKKYRNITKPMLLPILDSVYQIVPMPLHILLGLVLKFYNMLETTCRQIDRNDNESLYGV